MVYLCCIPEVKPFYNQMPDSIKISLLKIQKQIQNLNSTSGNIGFLQQLLREAGQLIGASEKTSGEKILEYCEELNFYKKDGEDKLVRFKKCKAESLAIIANQISN